MEKEFVPYELALRMKQLGFNERCFKYEDAKKICENNARPEGCQLPNVHCGYPNCTIDRSVEPLAIPIWQQAFRWFRENFNLINLIGCYPNTKKWYSSYQNLDWSGKETIEFAKTEDRSIQFETYKEAELACLEKLIEIVEQKEK
jgi:hypothetical protein